MLLLALVGITAATLHALQISPAEAWRIITDSPMSRVFEWDAGSTQSFWRQFVSGIFIVIVMTGLDQDMMQKNLTCRDLPSAQKDMCLYGLTFLPINALLLALGVLFYHLAALHGISLPAKADQLLPTLIVSGQLGMWVIVPFSIGIVAAAFSAADGALTALTTSVCIDFFRRPDDPHLRRRVHFVIALLCYLCLLLFHAVGGGSIINTIFVLASYTYGPLLGLFFYGLYTRRQVYDRWVPLVAVLAPTLCLALDHYAPLWWNYTFGYELLLLNGALTAFGLWLLRKPKATALAV